MNTDDNPVPPAFLAAAERALTDALSTGELGYPMMNAQARILDAKFDPQLSTEDAFVAAAIRAYREATQGNVQLLEPIMKVTVTTPSEFLGNVIGDLTARRGVDRTSGIGPDRQRFEVDGTGAAGETVHLCERGAQPEPGPRRGQHRTAQLRGSPRRGAAAVAGGLRHCSLKLAVRPTVATHKLVARSRVSINSDRQHFH